MSRGRPREPYDRVTLVAPGTFTLEQWLELAKVAYKDRRGMGFSYDDAGLGDLDRKEAILYGIPPAERPAFVSWYAAHYPGTTVTFAELAGTVAAENKRPIFGIDVSHWQTQLQNAAINWDKAAGQGITFAFIKATEGATGRDPDFVANWQGAAARGIARGAYHYYRNGQDPYRQAEQFLAQVAPGGALMGELSPALDLEDTRAELDPDGWLAWLEYVEHATGRRPFIYTASWYWQRLPRRLPWAGYYPLWLAAPGSSPGAPAGDPVIADYLPADTWPMYTVLQYSHTGPGRLYGADSHAIDLNWYAGSLAELRQVGVRPAAVPSPGGFAGGGG